MTRFPRIAAGLAAATLYLSATGCRPYDEHVCASGEVPVYAVDNPTGAQCIPRRADPPTGFATYPEGRVPAVVGDRYDRWPLADDYPWRDEVDPDLLRPRP